MSECYLETDNESLNVFPEVKCEFCDECALGEEFPFEHCRSCGDRPSWHHGRCCPEKQERDRQRLERSEIDKQFREASRIVRSIQHDPEKLGDALWENYWKDTVLAAESFREFYERMLSECCLIMFIDEDIWKHAHPDQTV